MNVFDGIHCKTIIVILMVKDCTHLTVKILGIFHPKMKNVVNQTVDGPH